MRVHIMLKTPWWTGLYLKSLMLFCMTFNTTPDSNKVSKFILKHSTCRVVSKRV